MFRGLKSLQPLKDTVPRLSVSLSLSVWLLTLFFFSLFGFFQCSTIWPVCRRGRLNMKTKACSFLTMVRTHYHYIYIYIYIQYIFMCHTYCTHAQLCSVCLSQCQSNSDASHTSFLLSDLMFAGGCFFSCAFVLFHTSEIFS